MILVTMVRIRPYKFVLLSTKGDFPSWERIVRRSDIPKNINKENSNAVIMVIELIGSSEEAQANVNWSKLLGCTTKINLEKYHSEISLLITLVETFYTDSNDQPYKVG